MEGARQPKKMHALRYNFFGGEAASPIALDGSDVQEPALRRAPPASASAPAPAAAPAPSQPTKRRRQAASPIELVCSGDNNSGEDTAIDEHAHSALRAIEAMSRAGKSQAQRDLAAVITLSVRPNWGAVDANGKRVVFLYALACTDTLADHVAPLDPAIANCDARQLFIAGLSQLCDLHSMRELNDAELFEAAEKLYRRVANAKAPRTE